MTHWKDLSDFNRKEIMDQTITRMILVVVVYCGSESSRVLLRTKHRGSGGVSILSYFWMARFSVSHHRSPIMEKAPA